MPEDSGYFHTHWSCETLAEVLAWEAGISKSAVRVRRGLRRLSRTFGDATPASVSFVGRRSHAAMLLRELCSSAVGNNVHSGAIFPNDQDFIFAIPRSVLPIAVLAFAMMDREIGPSLHEFLVHDNSINANAL